MINYINLNETFILLGGFPQFEFLIKCRCYSYQGFFTILFLIFYSMIWKVYIWEEFYELEN